VAENIEKTGNTQEKIIKMEPATPTIPGRYVTLVPLEPHHIVPLFHELGLPGNNHMLLNYLQGFPYVRSPEELHNHLFTYLAERPTVTMFAVLADTTALGPPRLTPPTSHTTVAGFASYKRDPTARVLRLDDTVYAPTIQQSYASTEIHYLLLRHLFEEQEIPYSKVGASNNSENVQSRKYTKRMGYTYEGTLRKDNVTRWGTTRDTDHLSMLREEWPRNKAILESWLAMENFDERGRQKRSLEKIRAETEAGERGESKL
jgi:hypothetical protein